MVCWRADCIWRRALLSSGVGERRWRTTDAGGKCRSVEFMSEVVTSFRLGMAESTHLTLSSSLLTLGLYVEGLLWLAFRGVFLKVISFFFRTGRENLYASSGHYHVHIGVAV